MRTWRDLGLAACLIAGCSTSNGGDRAPAAEPAPGGQTMTPTPPTPTPTPTPAPARDLTALARRVHDLGYLELFQRMEYTHVDELWKTSAADLDALVRDASQDHLARFLAAEILFLRSPGYPPADARAVLAPLYAEALVQTGARSGGWGLAGNMWGFLYERDDLGSAGEHVMAIGADMVPALRPLLDNTDVILYEGSQEATLGNSLRYRVKDVAAYFIGRLTKTPVAFHPAPADRDRELAKLAKSLP
jgi:hypothetical protein